MTPAAVRPALIRAFFASRRALDLLVIGLARGLLDGFWLGVLSDERLAAIDASYYEGRRQYLDRTYNTKGLWDWERECVEAHFAPGARVVVTGAGGGREVLALAGMGFEATGYECNATLRDFGNGLLAGTSARILPVERDVWPDTVQRFDCAVVGWGSYMLIPGRARRTAFLRAAVRSLAPGAPVLLSFFHREGSPLYFRAVAGVAAVLRLLSGAPTREPGDALAPTFVHYFTQRQIEDELAAAGFELVTYGTREYGHAVARVRSAGHG